MGLKIGAGSSTAGRGTPSDVHHRIQCVRFIPADAGTHMNVGSDRVFTWFISLARGTLPRRRLCATAKRFIPAGAGTR